ncbi:MAG TPA: rhodanese-like domain-containing protein [Pyrinomonadaceae bacterium]
MARKLFIPLTLALAASAALLGACKATDTAGTPGATTSRAAGKSATTGTTEVHADGVRRVGPAELKEMVDEGRTVVYDTRAKGSYDYEHIKGALSMPHEEVEKRAGEFPRDKTLVFYCT